MKNIYRVLLIYLIFTTHANSSFAANNIPPFPNEAGPKTFDRGTIEGFKNSFKDVVIHGFRGAEKFQSSRLQRSYFMTESGDFYGDFLIANYTDEEKKYKLYFFIDYTQKKYRAFNEESIFHNVIIKKQSELVIPVVLNNISDGAHDLLIVAVNEKNGILNQTNVLAHRANIYVKNGGFENIKFIKLTESTENSTETEIVISGREKTNFELNLNGISNSKYYLHLNNYYKKSTRYSLIVLLNSKQISVGDLKKEGAYYFKLNKFSKNVMPIELDVESTKKELLAIVVDNPYTVLEPERSIFFNFNSRVRISNKLF